MSSSPETGQEEKTNNQNEDKGLPPVAPPSGKHIAQLFLVPGLIVAAIVLFLIAAQWIFGVRYTAEKFLEDLSSSSMQVRWRAANDLSQILPRDSTMASHPELAITLAQRLKASLLEADKAEKEWKEELARVGGDESKADKDKFKRVMLLRGFNHYLIACLGHFHVPAGIGILSEIVIDDKNADQVLTQRRRSNAVLALGQLGQQAQNFFNLTPARQNEVLTQLEQLEKKPEKGKEELVELAGFCHALLKRSKKGYRITSEKVQGALSVAANGTDPQIRHHAAIALGFWNGNRVEELLDKLAQDDGQGKPVIVEASVKEAKAAAQEAKQAGKPVPQSFLPKARSPEHFRRQIRYQAVTALAMRGSQRTENYLPLLQKMLDVDHLMKEMTFDGKVAEGMVQATLMGAMRGTAKLVQKQPKLVDASIRQSIEKLTKHPNSTINTEAKTTMLVLNKHPLPTK